MKKITSLADLYIITSCLLITSASCHSGTSSSSSTSSNSSASSGVTTAPVPAPKARMMLMGGTSIATYCTLPGEDTIYLVPDTIHVSTANSEFNLMSQTIFISQSGVNVAIDTVDNTIDTGRLRALYNKAVSLGTGTPTSRMVTVLQIKYGIYNNTIKLYYKPLCLAWDSAVTINGTQYNAYSNHHSFDSNYYVYTSRGFQIAGYKLHFQPDSASYVNNIRIRHQINQKPPTVFNWASDSTGDVRCGFYPFQEIYGLIKNNPKNDTIKISNVAEQILVTGASPNPYIKHAVIFGPKNFSMSGSGLFYNIYADLEALCPPQCGMVLYQIE